MNTGEIILYTTSDGATALDVRLEQETLWLTQKQIAELLGTKRPAITKHLKNIFSSGELDENSTCSILEHMGNDGKQRYQTTYYNLDAILSIGYRVNSKKPTPDFSESSTCVKPCILRIDFTYSDNDLAFILYPFGCKYNKNN